ncbi:MAG: hypothetical protein AAB681_00820 [Patescibacteria group bacterium]
MNPKHKSLWSLFIIVAVVLVLLLLRNKSEPITVTPQDSPSDLEAAVGDIIIPDYSESQ